MIYPSWQKLSARTSFYLIGSSRQNIKRASRRSVRAAAHEAPPTAKRTLPFWSTLKDLKLIKEVVGNTIRIKVAGGINTYEEAIAFINAGVTRIGTSPAVAIVTNVSRSSSTRPESSE